MTKKILIIGAGFLGTTIEKIAIENNQIVFSTKKNKSNLSLDIRDNSQIKKIINKISPDTIINCSAITNLDDIEKKPTLAYEINSIGAKNLANISKQNNIKFIQISTDGIFDGKKQFYSESDIPSPINEYARSKQKGETLVLENNENSIIIRTNFYGFNNENKFLFNWILSNLKNNREFNAFSDIIFNPLEITNLSKIILELIEKDFQGIINLCGSEVFSKYDFANKIANVLGYDSSLIHKDSIQNSSLVAERPSNTTLSNKFMNSMINTKVHSLEYWLRKNSSNFL